MTGRPLYPETDHCHSLVAKRRARRANLAGTPERSSGTAAWWAGQDLNLQPDRYEREVCRLSC